VKGLYPTEIKGNKTTYGYRGKLTQLHDDMVLVLPYFTTDKVGPAPACIAYMPRSEIRKQTGSGFRCAPAKFSAGRAVPRKSFDKYFDRKGLVAMASEGWGARVA
jgi:hypothetical protein